MKGIILAAGKGDLHLSTEESIPKCLTKYDEKITVLDKILFSLNSNGISNVSLVGGFKIEKIMSRFPNIKYYYNEKWKDTKSLYSLLKAITEFNDDDVIISYSDIVYNPTVIETLLDNPNDIVLAYDSIWTKRYEGRTDSYLEEAEKIFKNNNSYTVSKDGSYKDSIGEFAGLMVIKKQVFSKLTEIISELLQKGEESITDLVKELSVLYRIDITDIKGHWAELDSSQDLIQFKFGTKAETLKKLENSLNFSTVLPQYSFVVEDYTSNKNLVVNTIMDSFDSSKLVIRSSALNEDTHNSSMAGNYESILNIPRTNEKAVNDAIDIVINSYLKGEQEQNPKNQILVQPMLEDVKMSGVLFTKDLETSAPYYTINYDLSGSTESITSGSKGEHHTLIFYKFSKKYPENENIKLLINAVKELENSTGYSSLDIEFAVSNNKLYILQVRPIAAHKNALKVYNNDITMELNNIKEYILSDGKRQNKLLGEKTAYGVMPDWNPAEIIGINPKPLSFSLYKEIITDRIWPLSRLHCGYRDTLSHPGILSFSGKPYIDIRMSFNSFTPASLSDKCAKKLIDFYIEKLNRHPEFHDKVEFNIAITAYDLTINERLMELKDSGFSDIEIKEIKKSFLDLTNSIILEENISINNELDKTRSLETVRKQMITADINPLSKVTILLDAVKEKGTLPFSNLARFGFIGVIILKSLRSLKIISDDDYDNFFKSIHTVAKEFVSDIHTLTKNELITKYGHLRPGTYEISSPAYHENFENYINSNNKPGNEKSVNFHLSEETYFKIDEVLKEHGLKFNHKVLLDFIRKATEGREMAKFEFSKNLSLSLDYIREYCESIGISREDASYLKTDDIYDAAYGSISSNIINEWRTNIQYRKSKHLITSAIKLPELILSEKDLDYFFLAQSKPNFVTQKHLTAELVILSDNDMDIEGKIVCIENADPGFDWIFSHNISGLITKYGGTNSHMAIRCAEFDLPAAIGCGDSIYDSLKFCSRVYLDCLGQKIEVLS